LLWLGGLLVWVTVLSTVHEELEGSSVAVLSWLLAVVSGVAFFLWTPYVLLGRRVRPRRLLTTALATGVALGVLALGSDVVMPELVTHNTARYGLVGLTFSLVSWLFSGAVLVISAAILGALLDRRAGAEPRPASA
jgi:membrane protein